MSDKLDQTLPPELQTVVAKASHETQETHMPEISEAKVTELATQAAANLLKEKDAAKAVATKIESLTNEATAAKEALAQANANLTAAQAQVKELETKSTAVVTEKTTLTQKIAELEGAKAALQTQVNKMTAEKVVADRKAKLVSASLANETLTKRFTEQNEDGSLKISDESFNQSLADLTAAFESGKAAVKPAETPKTETPAVPVKTEASKTEVPAQPDLSQVDQYTQGVAALAAGSVKTPSVDGRKKFADMFKA